MRVKHVQPIRRKGGKVDYYHRITRERLPDDPEQCAARALAINEELAEAKAEQKKLGNGQFDTLVADYRASPEYKTKAEKTRRDYARYLSFLENEFGQSQVRDLLDREFVLELRDLFSDTPRKADMMVRMVSILFGYALERPKKYRLRVKVGETPVNPCIGIKKLYKSDGGFLPWPEAVQEAFFAAAYPELRRIAQATLYMGQRGGDMVKVAKSHIERFKIRVVQNKTGEPLKIPMHPRLVDILAEIPSSDQLIVFTTKAGVPWTEHHLRHEVQKVMTKIGHPGYTPHGLRKNAVVNLLEAGCTEAQTAAVTGQTMQMIEYYARQVNKEKLATAAIRKLAAADRKKAKKSVKTVTTD